jgi:hypothetical protein
MPAPFTIRYRHMVDNPNSQQGYIDSTQPIASSLLCAMNRSICWPCLKIAKSICLPICILNYIPHYANQYHSYRRASIHFHTDSQFIFHSIWNADCYDLRQNRFYRIAFFRRRITTYGD